MLTFRRQRQKATYRRDIMILALVVRVQLDTLVVGISQDLRALMNVTEKLSYMFFGQRLGNHEVAFVSPELKLLSV